MSHTSAIVVTYDGDLEMVEACIASLRSLGDAPFETIISDNSPDGRFAAHFSADPSLITVRNSHNGGFTGGTWSGAQLATGDRLFFVNPDARVAPDCLSLLNAALTGDPFAVIAGAQIMLPDGTVNAGEGPVHFSGLSWCGNYRGVPARGPARPAFTVSGCAYLIDADVFCRFHGFRSRFEMYYDDTDLCWRTYIAGLRTLFVPEAHVEHDYKDKGPYRWLWVERNRLWMLLSNTERKTLLTLAPGLAFMEACSWVVALSGGWWRYKLRAYGQIALSPLWLLRERRAIGELRTVPDSEVITRLVFELETPGRMPPLSVRLANQVLGRYGRWVRRVLDAPPN
jgi:GT2 family glycosyltransferase